MKESCFICSSHGIKITNSDYATGYENQLQLKPLYFVFTRKDTVTFRRGRKFCAKNKQNEPAKTINEIVFTVCNLNTNIPMELKKIKLL